MHCLKARFFFQQFIFIFGSTLVARCMHNQETRQARQVIILKVGGKKVRCKNGSVQSQGDYPTNGQNLILIEKEHADTFGKIREERLENKRKVQKKDKNRFSKLYKVKERKTNKSLRKIDDCQHSHTRIEVGILEYKYFSLHECATIYISMNNYHHYVLRIPNKLRCVSYLIFKEKKGD